MSGFPGSMAKKVEWKSVLAVALIGIAFFVRWRWLADMEFKYDERDAAVLVSLLDSKPLGFLAPISTHSGVAHSSGGFYWFRWLSLDPADPLSIVRGVAGFNAFALAVAIALNRRSAKWLLALAMMATSATLVFGSRKIWVPDLMAPWVILSMGLLGWAREKRLPADSVKDRLAIALSGFCLVMSGHMYLPGGLVAAVATVVLAAGFIRSKAREEAWSWLAGCGLGWLTFIPYFYLMFIHAPGSRAAGGAGHWAIRDSVLLEGILKSVALGPSTFPFLGLYVRGAWESLGALREGWVCRSALFWLVVGGATTLLLYWIALVRMIRNWREAARDPLVLTTGPILLVYSVALFATRLGSHLHYWLAVLPFLYYLIAWAATLGPESRVSVWLTRGGWFSAAAVLAGTLYLQALIHELKGFPGEYWIAYRNPDNSLVADYRAQLRALPRVETDESLTP